MSISPYWRNRVLSPEQTDKMTRNPHPMDLVEASFCCISLSDLLFSFLTRRWTIWITPTLLVLHSKDRQIETNVTPHQPVMSHDFTCIRPLPFGKWCTPWFALQAMHAHTCERISLQPFSHETSGRSILPLAVAVKGGGDRHLPFLTVAAQLK
jgi:hypothetical protein